MHFHLYPGNSRDKAIAQLFYIVGIEALFYLSRTYTGRTYRFYELITLLNYVFYSVKKFLYLLIVIVLSALYSFISSVQAARPMITDDARIVDAKACQLESWSRRDQSSTEFWALPACNFTDNLELTAGGARTYQADETKNSDVMLQGKMLLKALDTNGWGIGLAAGTVHHFQVENENDWYAYAPASFSFKKDQVVLHTNLGWLREAESRRHYLTWGIGSETQLNGRIGLIAETFGQNQGKPLFQIGFRYWLVPDRIQIDTTYGDQFHGSSDVRWFSIGLRLLSKPFLP